MEGGGHRWWRSSLVGGGSLCLWGLVVHPWGIVVVGEWVAAVPGLCRARLVVAIVVFVCARAGHCHTHAGRRCACAGRCGTRSGCCCGRPFWLLLWSSGHFGCRAGRCGCHGCSSCWVVVVVIRRRRLGMLVTWEVFGVVDEGCCGWVSCCCGGDNVGPTCRLAHGGRSRHVVVTNGGNVVVVGDGGRRVCCDCVW